MLNISLVMYSVTSKNLLALCYAVDL